MAAGSNTSWYLYISFFHLYCRLLEGGYCLASPLFSLGSSDVHVESLFIVVVKWMLTFYLLQDWGKYLSKLRHRLLCPIKAGHSCFKWAVSDTGSKIMANQETDLIRKTDLFSQGKNCHFNYQGDWFLSMLFNFNRQWKAWVVETTLLEIFASCGNHKPFCWAICGKGKITKEKRKHKKLDRQYIFIQKVLITW